MDTEAKSDHLIQIREVELEEILKEFHWKVGESAETLEATLYSELQALEAVNIIPLYQSIQAHITHLNILLTFLSNHKTKLKGKRL